MEQLRRNKTTIPPLAISSDWVKRVSSFWFLGLETENNLTWSVNTTIIIIKKAQQRLHFLRVFRNNHVTPKLLLSFIGSISTYCMCVVLQLHSSRQKSTTESCNHSPKDHWMPSPLLEELHNTHSLFEVLPSSRRFRALKTCTKTLKNSFVLNVQYCKHKMPFVSFIYSYVSFLTCTLRTASNFVVPVQLQDIHVTENLWIWVSSSSEWTQDAQAHTKF